MVIGIDIDDTLTDTFSYFQQYVAEACGMPLEYLVEHDISYENIPSDWKMDIFTFARNYFDRIVPSTPAKEGAVEAVRELKRLGHRIVIITARSTRGYTDPYSTTRKELENIGVPYDRLICSWSKAEACLDEHVELYIDDNVDNVRNVASVDVDTILFSSRLNRNLNVPFRRAESWADILSYVKERS